MNYSGDKKESALDKFRKKVDKTIDEIYEEQNQTGRNVIKEYNDESLLTVDKNGVVKRER